MNIKKIRIALSLSQKDFAKGLDLSYSLYNKIENSTNRLTLATIVKLHEKYNVNPNYLILGKEPMFICDSGNSTHVAICDDKPESQESLAESQKLKKEISLLNEKIEYLKEHLKIANTLNKQLQMLVERNQALKKH